MTDVIAIEGLVKTFGRTRALDGLDLEVRAGEVHGFLGLLHADAGRVALFGRDPWTEAVELHRRLAYVPGDVALWPTLTGGEIIDLLTRLRGGAEPRRRAELVERFALDPRKRARTYSTGNRQKVALVAALAAPAELLILDEPTSGLDPLMEATFRDVIAEARRDGTTVLLSSHILSEVEALADRVSIVRDGRIVEAGTLEALRHLTRTTVTAQLDRPADALTGMAGVHGLRTDRSGVRFQVDPAHLSEVFSRLTGLGLRAVTATPPTLEDLFLEHYQQPGGRPATTVEDIEERAGRP